MPNPYADMVAKMLLQAAQASADAEAQAQDRAMRRDEFRQNLALQREGMDLRRRESDAQIASDQARQKAAEAQDAREAKKFDLALEDRTTAQEDEDAATLLAENPDAVVGVAPLKESVRPRALRLSKKMRAEDALDAEKVAEAQAGPDRRSRDARESESRLRVSELQAKKFNLDIENNDEDRAYLRAERESKSRIEGIQSESLKLALDENRYNFGKRKVEDRLMRMGIRSPETRAAIYDKLAPVLTTQVFELASRSATTTDPVTGKVSFDDAAFAKSLASMTPYVDAAARAATLDVTDPAKAANMRANMKATAEKLAAAGSNPKAIGEALVGMLNAAIPDKKPPPPAAVNPNAESQLRLKKRSDATSSRAKDIAKDVIGNASDAFVYQLEAMFPDKTAEQIAELVAVDYDKAIEDLIKPGFGQILGRRGVSDAEKRTAFFNAASRIYQQGLK